MKAHVIKLRVEGKHVKSDPDVSKEHFAVGDTLTFVSHDGKPTVQFDTPHPFSAAKFEDGDQPVQVVNSGHFKFHCGVVLPNGESIGWPKDRNSGGGGQTT